MFGQGRNCKKGKEIKRHPDPGQVSREKKGRSSGKNEKREKLDVNNAEEGGA